MKAVSTSIAAIFASVAAVNAASIPDGTWPQSTGTVEHNGVIVVRSGETFDGKMQTYQRSDMGCSEQAEGTWRDAMFRLEAGATLKNVIIGENQAEGVHCNDHDCNLENVWWDDVCEDAWTIKNGKSSSVSKISGGGARYAEDKVVQFNGEGLVVIDNFYVEDFGKLARSCGTCGDKQRNFEISNVLAVDPKVSLVTVNENFGDTATLKNIHIKSDDDDVTVCAWSKGTSHGEPDELGEGIKKGLCNYSESDIHINE